MAVGAPIFEETLATVPVTVTAGPQFRLATLTFERVTALPLADLRVEADSRGGSAALAPTESRPRASRSRRRSRREDLVRRRSRRAQQFAHADAAVDVFSRKGPQEVDQEFPVDGLRQ